MSMQENTEFGCARCAEAWGEFSITMAFQPIIDVEARTVFAQEALVRGTDGRGAGEILALVNEANIHSFDQLCRATAIKVAAGLGIDSLLSINFLPNAVYNPRNCLQTTLAAAEQYGFPKERLLFEVTEAEEILDRTHLAAIVREYRSLGIGVAIDDFGAGHSGLNLLAEVEPDLVKIDRFLITDIDTTKRKQAILRATLGLCEGLGIRVICEGVETETEYRTLRDLGVRLFQGYLFARPALGALAPVDFDALAAMGP
jgi:EAL domain-containing protein (putative c-di-GMP-specific phosphodiesterase class I)